MNTLLKNKKHRRILVTGGAGYAGSVLVPKLLSEGHSVRVYDRFFFDETSLDHLAERKSVQIVKGDIRDRKSLAQALNDVDTVIHLADLSNDPSCELREDLTYQINRDAAQGLVQLCKDLNVPDFVFYSSCSVYGAGGDHIHTETSSLHPVSLYAQLKIEMEQYLLDEKSTKFRPVIFRNATLFGLSPRMRFDLAINVMTLYAWRDQRIFVLGGGEQWRPFLHIADLAAFTNSVLQHDFSKISGEIINVGHDDQNIRIKDLAKRFPEHFDGLNIEETPGDPDRRSYRVDFSKMQRYYDIQKPVSISSGIAEIKAALDDRRISDASATSLYNIKKMKEILAKPAFLGGEPVQPHFLPFCLPLLDKEEEEEVLATLRSGWLTTGPRTQCLESRIGEYIGNPNVVCVNSCTAALHLSLLAAGVGPGDEVITTSLTFISSANVILYCGATPVFADIDPQTLLIDPQRVRDVITPRTKAIIVVDLAGMPVNMEEFLAIGKEYGVTIIEDAAHAIGTEYKQQKVGSIADFTCFSFYPIKNMTTVEGGAISFKKECDMGEIRALSLHGMSKDAWKRYDITSDNAKNDKDTNGRPPKATHWDMVTLGYKYNMTDVEAAVGLRQINKLDRFIEKRQELAHYYTEELKSIPGITPIGVPVYEHRHAWHLFIVTVDENEYGLDRDELMTAMKAENVGTSIHFRPVHQTQYYSSLTNAVKRNLPVTEHIGSKILSLPLYPGMSNQAAKNTIEALRKLHAHFGAKHTQEAVSS